MSRKKIGEIGAARAVECQHAARDKPGGDQRDDDSRQECKKYRDRTLEPEGSQQADMVKKALHVGRAVFLRSVAGGLFYMRHALMSGLQIADACLY